MRNLERCLFRSPQRERWFLCSTEEPQCVENIGYLYNLAEDDKIWLQQAESWIQMNASGKVEANKQKQL